MNSLIASCTFELKDSRSIASKSYNDIQIFRNIFGLISESWLADRTKTVMLPFKSHITQQSEIPNFSNCSNIDLKSICINRAKEIISQNKLIYFAWSGGIDSTLALVSFILAGVNRDQLIVVCNNDSIREYSEFYLKHIVGNFKIQASELLMQNMKNNMLDGIFLSCEQGDCMYGQDLGMLILDMFGPEELWKRPDRKLITTVFKTTGMTDQAANCWYDIFNETVKHSPRPIETVYDFSWWITYNWRWQWAFEKINLRLANDLDIQTFFSSLEFQHWTVNHQQFNILKKSQLKIDFKKIILEYTRDENYFNNKIKHPSATIYYSADAFSAIDNNRKRIKSCDFSILDYYQPNNFINDWLAS